MIKSWLKYQNVKICWKLHLSKAFIILKFDNLLWPILGCISLLTICVITSGRKLFWMDEILTYYAASMPAFPQMISFVNDKINLGSPLYFITIWLWAKAFSASELSLRLFSSLGFCAALIITWSMLRRVYGLWSANLSTLAVFLGSAVILYQNSEARFYGLLLALCALLSKQTIVSLTDVSFKIRTALTQILLHGLLPLAHPFGFVYSFMHTVAAILMDLRRGVFRLWYYLTAFAGWLFYIPFIPALLKQSELTKPHFWISIPTLNNLKGIYFGDHSFNSIVFTLLALALFLSLKAERPQKTNDEPILILGALYALLPLGIWLESQKFMPLFLDRYFIGIKLSWAIFLSAIFSRILLETEKLRPSHRIVLSLIAAMIMALPINNALKLHQPESPDAYVRHLKPTLPIAMDSPFSYLQFVHYSLDAKRYYYVLDCGIAVRDDNSLHATNDFQTLQALKSYVPELNIITTKEFLNKYSSFIVLAFPERKWFEYRIKNNPQYRIQYLGNVSYLVETKTPEGKVR